MLSRNLLAIDVGNGLHNAPAVSLGNTIFFHFFSQGASVQAKQFGRFALVMAHMLQYRLQQGFFDFDHDQRIQAFNIMSGHVFQVSCNGLLDMRRQRRTTD
jgi:hypothetical protein